MNWLKIIQSSITSYASRKRLKERGIRWKERYREKSLDVKKKFEKILPGSYYRWEGFDYTTAHPYYVVVGPSISRRYGKSFFAGVKRLPKDPKKHKVYSPSGKYFPSLVAALSYASKMWGIPFPQNPKPYNKTTLVPIDIPRHIKG